MSSKVFISYAYPDRNAVPSVVEALREQGVATPDSVFLDEQKMVAGSSVRGALRDAISSADTVVLFWTDAAAKSQWVNYEAGMAEALGKQVVVVMPESSTAQLPASLQDVQVVRLSEG